MRGGLVNVCWCSNHAWVTPSPHCGINVTCFFFLVPGGINESELDMNAILIKSSSVQATVMLPIFLILRVCNLEAVVLKISFFGKNIFIIRTLDFKLKIYLQLCRGIDIPIVFVCRLPHCLARCDWQANVGPKILLLAFCFWGAANICQHYSQFFSSIVPIFFFFKWLHTSFSVNLMLWFLFIFCLTCFELSPAFSVFC